MINFVSVGAIQGLANGEAVLANPTSLQFGPDGRLYVSEQDGTINAFEVDIENGEYIATDHEVLVLPDGKDVVQSIQNHNDDGSLNSDGRRQVTGLVVGGTAENPVLYISSSDPRIAKNGDKNLDTNSGVITRVTWTGSAWDAVDIVRGLPRSEENHSNNGMVLDSNNQKLYLAVGGFTNDGAPSKLFSYTAEYALAGTVLEIDLNDLESRDILIDAAGGQGGTSRKYIYDLPTLDDPSVANDTNGISREDDNGLDKNGPWGGNDGLNMAILPADAPLRIYADGFRNHYDLVMTEAGKLYTIDNGKNSGAGGSVIQDANGEATQQPNDVSDNNDNEPLFLVEEGGYYGHANPARSNQDLAWTVFNDEGTPDTSVSPNTVPNLSELVPDSVQIADGFLIDPTKFTGDPTRLAQSGVPIDRDSEASNQLGLLTASSNGLVEYTGDAFDGALKGDLLIASFDGNIYRADLNSDGTALQNLTSDGKFNQDENKLISGLTQALDITTRPDGTVWVLERSAGQISVYSPSDTPPPVDLDFDNDGIDDRDDPFFRDATNGQSLSLIPGQSLLFDFVGDSDPAPGPSTALPGGFTGVMINGTQSLIDNLNNNLDNIKFETAALGGTTVIEKVSNGDPFQTPNNGEFLLHTGITIPENVNTFNIKWTLINPGLSQTPGDGGFTGPFQQIGGYIGTGDQSNYLKVVAIQHGGGELQIALENNDEIVSSTLLQADDLFEGQTVGSRIFLDLEVDALAQTATPTITYEVSGDGPDKVVTGSPVDLSNTAIIEAIQGEYQVQEQNTGLAVGLFSTNAGQSQANALQAVFDEIEITATEQQVPPDAMDDELSTGIDTGLTISVSELLSNDTDLNLGDTLTVVNVSNPVNGTVEISDDASTITFTPNSNFFGPASFDYTISDGTANDTATVNINVADRAVLYRVNAGGATVNALASDPVQLPWVANSGSGAQSGIGFSNNTGNVSSQNISNQNDPTARDASLPDYVPYAVFSSERWDPPFAPEMLWNFEVEAGGTYDVNLFVRNGFQGTDEAGDRIFDITIEGTEYFSDIDLSGTFGHRVGAMLSQTVTLDSNDSSLDIEFLHDVENPLINAIEIVQVGEGVTLPTVSIASPNVASVEETGDTNFTTLEFPVIFDSNPSSDVTVEYSVDINGTVTSGLTQNLGTENGVIVVDVPNDDVANGPESITVTLTGLPIGDDVADLEQTVASATVTEDDLVNEEPSSFLLTLNNGKTLNGVALTSQDIALYDGSDYTLFFDGSDLGIDTGKIDAFDVINETEVLLSFDTTIDLPVLGAVDEFDVVKFTATNLGADTAGDFSLFFDGSDLGFNNSGEDINALQLLPNGDLLLSILGRLNPGTGVIAENEDLVRFAPTSLGTDTAGTLSVFFDGSDVGLADEAINGFSASTEDLFYLSLTNNFAVGDVLTENEDVLIFSATSTGDTTDGSFSSQLFFDGSEAGLQFRNVSGLDFPLTDLSPSESLSLELSPSSISEDGGVTTATVSRTGDTSTDVTVTLSSSDLSEATIDQDMIVIEAGQSSTTVQISAVNDIEVDGSQTATITAMAPGLVSDSADLIVNDDDMPPTTAEGTLLALNSNTNLSGQTITTQDIAYLDGTNYSLFFDGSDVGLTSGKIDAFDAISSTEILMSFQSAVTLPDIGEVDDSDIVLFNASSLGETTAGSFSMYFDGSDVGLSNGGEDIDALTGLSDGSLLISVNGKLNPGDGIIASDEDLVQFTPSSLGENTAGDFAVWTDGSDIGIEALNVDAFSLDNSGEFYFSFTDAFDVAGLVGEDEDVVSFSPTSTGTSTSGSFNAPLYLDGSEQGLQFRDVIGIDVTFSNP